jgi:putative toxin-antitoxin system antitoxin component (TIGR02293 family)
MPELAEAVAPWSVDVPAIEPTAEILGGPEVLQCDLGSPLAAHELLLRGLPGAALTHLVDNLALLQDPAALERAIGISWRTLQRRKADPARRLSQEQSGRMWKFAEILAKATVVLGSRSAAEDWLERSAIGLDGHRPLDLLATAAGVEIVEDYLERMEYGVYT